MQSVDSQVIHADRLDRNRAFEADVVVVGTGAGGGVTAEVLSGAGLKVVMLEEGGYYTRKDFRMREGEAYTRLYYNVGARKTRDKGITILQGRTVGGSTTVNWTSCFRAPPETLAHWTEVHGLKGWSEADMAPWFERMEKRLGVEAWPIRNPSNDTLHRGATKLGWHVAQIPRNVKACRNLGYCGMGCPVDAKQSMLVTTIPAALARGALLVASARAERLEIKGDRVTAVEAVALTANHVEPTGVRIRVEAPYVVLAGGGINSPALLLRSGAPDPYARLGKRTFLHVTNASTALMPEKIEPFYGAPQSVYSNQFLFRDGVAGRIGYKLEIAPLHPVTAAVGMLTFGREHAALIQKLPHMSPAIALLRDGFHPESPGGTVTLADDGSPILDYPLNDYLWEGVRHAYLSMAEFQFAAGATRVLPSHMDAPATGYRSLAALDRALGTELALAPVRAQLYSAHVMGGCVMGEDPRTSVVNSEGRHHQLANTWVIDGSTFPTSLGANPSLTIYAMAARQASALAQTAAGRKRDE